MNGVQIYRNGICCCSVCAPKEMTGKEIERQVNADNPTGINSEWRISEKPFATGETNPCGCEQDSGRRHFLLNC